MASEYHQQNQDDDKQEWSAVTTEDEPKGFDNDVSSCEKPAEAPPQKHTCGICGKNFGSGKALGGHKRSHIQALKKAGESSGKKGNRNALTFCSVCHKGFTSKKALHGHMRSHPERYWRGVNPPSPAPDVTRGFSFPNSNDSDDDDDYYDNGVDDDVGSRYLSPEWGRSHKRKIASSHEVVSQEVFSAAEILMQMSRDKWPQPPQHVKHEINGGRCDRPNGENTSLESEDEEETETESEEEDDEHAYRTKVMYMNEALKGTNGMRGHDETAAVEVKENGKRKMVRIKYPNLGSNAENSRRFKDEYQCDICHKTFPTPQALGGHKSSHGKGKNNWPLDEAAGESSRAGGARVWDFDLNDEYPPKVKQEEI